MGKHGEKLKPYYSNVKSGDSDNREGIAARIYFQELFGDDFIRDRTKLGVNACLNYGYTILRASVARALVSSGLSPAIGIFHHNRSNAFPLVDDFMEPYRPYVDEIVYEMSQTRVVEELDREAKAKLINVLYCDTKFNTVTRPLQVGLSISSASLVKCYAKNELKLSFPTIE
jgi:CRISPR-associated protein Cas1